DADDGSARADVPRVFESAADFVLIILEVDHAAADDLDARVAEFLARGGALFRRAGQLEMRVFERNILDAGLPAACDSVIHGELSGGIRGHADLQTVELLSLFLGYKLRVLVRRGQGQGRGQAGSRQPDRI